MNELPARVLARIAGALYLTNILLGVFALGIVPSALTVAGDAAATAHHIQANELLYRSSLAAHVIVTLTNVPLAVIFWELFKVVNRRAALLVVFFTLVATGIEVAGMLNQFATLALLDGPYSKAFTPGQLQALAYLPFDLQANSYSLSVAFFAFYDMALGYLVFRSTFLPRAIGVLLAIGGLAYLTHSFAIVLAPTFAAHLFPYIGLPSLAGEGSFTLWLLIVGVNSQKWTERGRQPRSATDYA